MSRLIKISNDWHRKLTKMKTEYKLKNGFDITFEEAIKLDLNGEEPKRQFSDRWRFPKFTKG